MLALTCAAVVACGGSKRDPMRYPDEPSSRTHKHVLQEINNARSRGAHCASGESYHPQPPLRYDLRLEKAAQMVATLNRDEFGTRISNLTHTPRGTQPRDRVEAAGYDFRRMGENIAAGQRSPAKAVESWLQSTSGHCDTLMGDFSDVGVGYHRPYWAMVVGTE